MFSPKARGAADLPATDSGARPDAARASGSKSDVASFLMARDGWLRRLCSHPNLSGSDYAVAVSLGLHFNRKTGAAWPAMDTLAKLTNRNRTSVWRSMVRLEQLGLVVVVHSRGANKSNRYRPAFGNSENPAEFRRRTTPRGMLRTRNTGPANSQHGLCETAARTLDEPRRELKEGTSEQKHTPQEETTSQSTEHAQPALHSGLACGHSEPATFKLSPVAMMIMAKDRRDPAADPDDLTIPAYLDRRKECRR